MHSCVTILLELFQEIEEDSNEPLTSRQMRREERAPLKGIVRDALQLSLDRVEFGASNIKCMYNALLDILLVISHDIPWHFKAMPALASKFLGLPCSS